MPIDPNIALGVRPIEQPNMLGQMAQVMALRQAQQEYEGSEGVNELARQGVKDPYAYLQHGKTGRATYESILKGQKDLREGQKLEVDLGVTKIGAFRDQLMANVNDPAAAARWLTAVNGDPLVGKVLSSIPLADQIAAIPSDPKGFADWKYKTALKAPDFIKHFVESADAQLKSRTDLAQTGMQINASNYRHFNRPEDVKLIGDQPFGVSNVNGQAVVREMPQPGAVGTPGPTFAPPAAGGGAGPSGGVVNRNSLVTQPNVNALNAQGGATPPVVATPPVAGAPPVVATGNPATPWKIARPPVLTEVDDPDVEGQKLKVDANIYKQGTGLGAPGVLGVARTEKLTPQQTLKLKAEMGKDFKAVEKTVAETDALLESIDAVRNSNLERVAGPVDARTFTMTNEGKLAETRFENLKGKVTAIAKTASTMTGAIGSIANQEWQILANQIAVLDLKNGKDPSLEQIDQLERQAMSIANRMRAGFERQYGEHLDTLGPQYKELPNVTYTPGSAGYTPTGKKTPTQSSATPASTGNIADNAGVARVINFGDMPK